MKVQTGVALFALAALCSAEIRPRASSSEYRFRQSANGLTLAAEIVPSNQVRSTFSSDLRRDYVVLEVALFPSSNGSLHVSPNDFLLHCGSVIVRPGNPQAIAAGRQQKNAPRRSNVGVYETAEIGYESGRSNNDGYGTRPRGVYTRTGVGVVTGGAGGSYPGSTDRDRGAMAQELEEKQLPEGNAAQPVAGYLYFPFPASQRKKVAYELEYNGTAARLSVPMPMK